MESARSESVWPNPTEPDNRKPKNPTQNLGQIALRAKLQPEMVISPVFLFYNL